MAHSMGSNVWQHFMQWVSSPAHGPGHHLKWVDTHVAQVVLIGNSLLGSPKVPPTFLLLPLPTPTTILCLSALFVHFVVLSDVHTTSAVYCSKVE